MRPLILIANDDGIESSHLTGLADALAEFAHVVVAAPERERSAMSQSITLHKPLRIDEVAPDRFSVSGTPVDCVYIGLRRLVPRTPDLVVSGINRGYNLGADVFYSGTVAAAVEAGLRDVPAVALSLAPGRSSDLVAAVQFSCELIRATLAHGLPRRTVLNVNMPPAATAGFRWTHMGERAYEDLVEERLDPRGRPYYWIGGGLAETQNEPGSDCHAVGEGLVSITPLHLDLTHHDLLEDAPTWHIAGYDLSPWEDTD